MINPAATVMNDTGLRSVVDFTQTFVGGDIGEGTFGDMSSTLMQRGSGRVYIAVVSSALAQAILQRQWGILHAFMLTRRVHPSRTLGPLKKDHSPELSQLRKMCVQR